MPIYEYSCRKCGAHMEVMQKISDKPLARHPKCGGKLEKEWSRTGFQFKGTGWYVTDYANKQSGPKEGKESKSDSPDSAAESKPTETKGAGAESKAGAEPKKAAAEPKGEAKSSGGKKTAGAPAAGGD